ncbi:cytadherence high molecular weight protein 2 [Culicoides brevitarsis]|uniref:cytadherence high molecular weight protein 2 n=1 Tax=Culicoides brevitarsis TaxID=469753 RepID=UPI00307CC3DA
MKVVKKYELIQPKTGETNRLFGTRYLKRHKMRDKRWTAADKMLQYSGLTRLYERDHVLRNITEASERKSQVKKVKEMRKELKQKNLLMRIAIHGDAQRIKNIVQHDKYMRRAFPKWDSYKIVERINDYTFMKRKKLDILKDQKQKLTDQYEKRLLEVAALQDRIKYQDTIEPKERSLTRKIEADLKNSETRVRTIMTVNRAYKKIIGIMLQDSIYYDSVLEALKEDMAEQEMFIQKTILLGKPAIATAIELQEEHTWLEQKTRREMEMRIKDLLEHREKIAENNKKVRTLVRRDEDFEIDPSRYDRDTPSIVELKKELEEVEKGIKALKLAALACEPLDIYPNMKEQSRKSERIIDQINRKEKEKNFALDRELHAHVIEESLKYDLTDDEIAKLGDIESMKLQIAEEKKKQEEIEEKIKSRADNFLLIRMAFQHLVEVLDTVGKSHNVVRKKAPGSMLNLPLLKFDKIFQKYKPPPPVEENIDNLLKVAKSKIDTIVKIYQTELNKENAEDTKILEAKLRDPKLTEKDKETIKKLRQKQKDDQKTPKWKDYHHAIVKELNSGYQAKGGDIDSVKGEVGLVIEDPSVLTRSQIKAMSAKIVDEMSKRDD